MLKTPTIEAPAASAAAKEAAPRTHLWLAALLCLVCLVSYANSFMAPFVFDDSRFVIRAGKQLAGGTLLEAVGRHGRPLLVLTMGMNYAVGELDVRGYHAFNIAVHLAAGLTLFGLIRQTLLLPGIAPRLASSATWLAFGVALLWLVHPLQTESVTYIIQRCESMMGLFFLLCLYCTVRGAGAAQPRNWYLGAVASMCLGMGSKEVMATAPFLVLLYDRIFLTGSWKQLWRRRWAMYAGFLVPLLWMAYRLLPVFSPGPRRAAGFGLEKITPWEYLRSQPGVILHYLRLSFWPDHLCLDYMWPMADSAAEIIPPALVVGGLLLASLWALWYRPRLGFLGISFFVILAPSSSIMPILDLAFEHRMYLPLAPLLILLVCGFHVLVNKLPLQPDSRVRLTVAVTLVVVVLLSGRTMLRNQLYGNPAAMWTNVVGLAPHNDRAHYNLGNQLARAEQYDQAMVHYRRSMELNPKDAHAPFNMGGVYERQKDYERAIEFYRLALKLNRRHENAQQNLARCLAEMGQLEEAHSAYQRSVRIARNKARALDNYGNFFARRGEFSEAVAQYRQALEADPDYELARRHLRLALQKQEEQAEETEQG